MATCQARHFHIKFQLVPVEVFHQDFVLFSVKIINISNSACLGLPKMLWRVMQNGSYMVCKKPFLAPPGQVRRLGAINKSL